MASNHPNEQAANVDSGNPVVNLIAQTILKNQGTWSETSNGSYVTDVSKIELFSSGKYDSQLQAAENQLSQQKSSTFQIF